MLGMETIFIMFCALREAKGMDIRARHACLAANHLLRNMKRSRLFDPFTEYTETHYYKLLLLSSSFLYTLYE